MHDAATAAGLDAWLDDAVGELSGFSDSDRPGWTREVFSEPYRASRAWTTGQMRKAGLEVHQDAAGNLVGRLPGTNPAAPALVTGSHTDTVDGGGRFDGVVGVLGALGAVQLLAERGMKLQRDLLVVDFCRGGIQPVRAQLPGQPGPGRRAHRRRPGAHRLPRAVPGRRL
ncbi:hypothetical protein N9A08_03575 [Arthrobacter koreensis]|uniref:Peptidase M28 domain-containing protein n=1 Tax=Arthrobacter koreensis TaxID=199136 RepID=A0ABY6FVG3_9MICC|nr:M28 family peptidase [Arthrobacter koreensis]UYB36767.1 hypothetical protein N9A08_03575 [Arthrobacter koreensis]